MEFSQETQETVTGDASINNVVIDIIHNGRKSITSVSGLNLSKEELKNMKKTLQKRWGCNANIKNTDTGMVLSLQGDQRPNLTAFLAKELGVTQVTYTGT